MFDIPKGEPQGNAVISPCGKYRYWLTRNLFSGHGTIVFVMLNPSKADAAVNDPTIRRCIGFAKDWGYFKLIVLNLYAFRATDPKELKKKGYLVGPHTDNWIRHVCQEFGDLTIVCGWGGKAEPERVEEFVKLVSGYPDVALRCLGVNKDGSPKHPLYLKSDTALVGWPVKVE